MKNVWLLMMPLFIVLFTFASCNDDDGPTIDLPAFIQTYIDNNYAGAEIEEAEQETLCDGTEVYEVELEVADDEEIELIFDSEGLLYTETEIDAGDLPAEVSASINATYADYTIEEAERLEMAGGANQYEVELKNGATQLEVLFAADGTVLCEEVDNDDDE